MRLLCFIGIHRWKYLAPIPNTMPFTTAYLMRRECKRCGTSQETVFPAIPTPGFWAFWHNKGAE